MKYLFTILLFIISTSCHSQYATKTYVDSLYNSFDSVIVKPIISTWGNSFTAIDTLSSEKNSTKTFQILIQTDGDNTVKFIMVRNLNGVYSVITDCDDKSFSFNIQKSFLSSKTLYSISTQVINNRVIIFASNKTNGIINWRVSRQQL